MISCWEEGVSHFDLNPVKAHKRMKQAGRQVSIAAMVYSLQRLLCLSGCLQVSLPGPKQVQATERSLYTEPVETSKKIRGKAGQGNKHVAIAPRPRHTPRSSLSLATYAWLRRCNTIHSHLVVYNFADRQRTNLDYRCASETDIRHARSLSNRMPALFGQIICIVLACQKEPSNL